MKRKLLFPNYWEIPRNWPVLYRAFSNTFEINGTLISYQDYPIIAYTPKGVWISDFENERFINLKAVRQWASLTKEEAAQHLMYRKLAQIRIIENQLVNAKATVKMIQDGNIHRQDFSDCFPFKLGF